MSEKDSYLLAITPPKDVSEKVDEYRKKYKKHTYFITPHITIYPPFYIDSANENDIISILIEKLKSIKSDEIIIDSLGYFENGNDTNVAYFKPNDSAIIYLREIFSICSLALRSHIHNKYESHPSGFKPHMTISSDIPNDVFLNIKSELKNTKELFKFKVESVDVYKQQGKSGIWNKIKEVDLKS